MYEKQSINKRRETKDESSKQTDGAINQINIVMMFTLFYKFI